MIERTILENATLSNSDWSKCNELNVVFIFSICVEKGLQYL